MEAGSSKELRALSQEAGKEWLPKHFFKVALEQTHSQISHGPRKKMGCPAEVILDARICKLGDIGPCFYPASDTEKGNTMLVCRGKSIILTTIDARQHDHTSLMRTEKVAPTIASLSEGEDSNKKALHGVLNSAREDTCVVDRCPDNHDGLAGTPCPEAFTVCPYTTSRCSSGSVMKYILLLCSDGLWQQTLRTLTCPESDELDDERPDQKPTCNGKAPSSGSLKDMGGTCQHWGFSIPWCFVDKQDTSFAMQSAEYPGEYLAICDITTCSGWSPTTGEFAGKGGTCDTWGSSSPWCWVEESYVGHGKEFAKESVLHAGKFSAPCRDSPHPAMAEVEATSQDGCNGWSPNAGPLAHKGHSCHTWGFAFPWCWVDGGPAADNNVVQPFGTVDGAWWAPCKPTTCSGWAPSFGSLKGAGFRCDHWSAPITEEWCWVEDGYVGPGSNMLQYSTEYKNKKFAFCGTSTPGFRYRRSLGLTAVETAQLPYSTSPMPLPMMPQQVAVQAKGGAAIGMMSQGSIQPKGGSTMGLTVPQIEAKGGSTMGRPSPQILTKPKVLATVTYAPPPWPISTNIPTPWTTPPSPGISPTVPPSWTPTATPTPGTTPTPSATPPTQPHRPRQRRHRPPAPRRLTPSPSATPPTVTPSPTPTATPTPGTPTPSATPPPSVTPSPPWTTPPSPGIFPTAPPSCTPTATPTPGTTPPTVTPSPTPTGTPTPDTQRRHRPPAPRRRPHAPHQRAHRPHRPHRPHRRQ
eukprot:TRINITY_DN4863_c0_g1_i13.p1 TRINITY_DN4863_c0_g1~~TRINITY_DN4863_c0_g1_i13.p1  ORF type:complete len:861 (-),score=73.45 TRINITY_DN4863_c0_g1_i13:64-2307(-)